MAIMTFSSVSNFGDQSLEKIWQIEMRHHKEFGPIVVSYGNKDFLVQQSNAILTAAAKILRCTKIAVEMLSFLTFTARGRP